jgi:hypothetical protein
MRTVYRTLVVVVMLLLLVRTGVEGGEPATLVVCAPGYPGTTAEAQPAMDGLAAAAAAAAGWGAGELAAEYHETEAGGLERLGRPDAALALVTLPFFLEHRAELGLEPAVQPVATGRPASEPWSLVAGAGRVAAPADLEGWELLSLAGHSPRFVRGPALGGWGELPQSLTITFSGAVLSGLRRAARGEAVVLLLDGPQTAALGRLPFAASLEVVHTSQPLPVSLLCTVRGRIAPDRAAAVVAALRRLGELPEAAEALAGVRLDRFVELDRTALESAISSFEGRR